MIGDLWLATVTPAALLLLASLAALGVIWASIKGLDPRDKARVLRAWGKCLRFWPQRRS